MAHFVVSHFMLYCVKQNILKNLKDVVVCFLLVCLLLLFL